MTGDIVADEPGALNLDDGPYAEPQPDTRFRSRYMAERGRQTAEAAPVRRRTPDHRYVLGEIRRIVIFGALMLAILIAAAVLLR